MKTKTRINLYSTNFLLDELEENKDKLIKISKLSNIELVKTISLLIKNIHFIDSELIPRQTIKKAFELTQNIDVDDTEFVALTMHINGKLWSGDRELIKGLTKKGWDKIISNDEIYLNI